jgi:hypothetical protein
MPANFHESYREREVAKTSSNRSFGLTVGGILIAIAIYRFIFAETGLGWPTLVFGTVGLCLSILGLVSPAVLAPLNYAWAKFGLLLAKVTNPLVMLLIYAIAFVPIGWVMRIFGHDPMRLKRSPHGGTYWIERSPPGPTPETMTDQF